MMQKRQSVGFSQYEAQRMAPKKKPPPVKDPEGCYFFPGCLEKVHPIVPKFKYTKQPEFSKPSQLCLYHLDWQPSQFYNICTYCAIFHRDDEVKLVKMPVEGKELKKMKDKKNKKKGSGGGKKGKKGAKSAAPKKGKGKGGKGGGDDEEKKDKPKEEPIKNEITIAICKQCLPIGCEVVTPVLEPPKEEPIGLL
ncbi:uncharacterized protein LOC142350357 isoform X2 [Convolutriloba macropyga]|uniref:uncharacterized protein LOC142350357 isoform X2 n=1 Tax=Convolutriloba macropyga TaxID=536237 RepID=UPI003F51E64D